MKKLLKAFAAGLLIVSMAACASTETETTDETMDSTTETTETEQEAEKVTRKIGVSIYKFDDNFMTFYRNDLQAYFEELSANGDVQYDVTIMDGKNDQAEQTNQIDNFIAQGSDALIINLVQSSSASSVIDKCEEANIPCIFINRQPTDEDMTAKDGTDYEGMYAYVGADARQSGKMQGSIIANLPDKGDINGDGVLSYIMIQGDPENVDAQYRTDFSISEYKALTGLEVNELDLQRGDWDQTKGQEIATNDLTKFGNEIEVIFANNDGMALGAVQAIQSAGRVVGEDIYLVGVDAIPDAIDKINAGLMTGTVKNDQESQAKEAADLTIDAINGTKLNEPNHVYMVDYIPYTGE